MVTHRLAGFIVDPGPTRMRSHVQLLSPDPSLERLSTRLVEHLPVYLELLDPAADSHLNIGRTFNLFGGNFSLAVPGSMCHSTSTDAI